MMFAIVYCLFGNILIEALRQLFKPSQNTALMRQRAIEAHPLRYPVIEMIIHSIIWPFIVIAIFFSMIHGFLTAIARRFNG